MAVVTGAKEEVRCRSIKSNKVCIVRRSGGRTGPGHRTMTQKTTVRVDVLLDLMPV